MCLGPVMLPNLLLVILLLIICIHCSSIEDFSSRVIQVSDITKAPFTAIILCTNSKYFCSGVIVDRKWVLTVAHCFHDLAGRLTEDDKSVLVVAGTNGLNNAAADIKSGLAQIRESKTLVIHKGYTWKQKFVNDTALIEVAEDFNTSERVAIAEMNTTNLEDRPVLPNSQDHQMEFINLPCLGYGYGRDDKITGQDFVVNKHCHCLECVRSYKSPVDILRQRNIFLCDSVNTEGSELCQGDNGGPLMCGRTLRALATAMFHYKDKANCDILKNPPRTDCGNPQTMYVFTDLCYFTDWLSSVDPVFPRLNEQCMSKTNK